MERPIMKENLKGYSLEEAHKLYTDCPELYRHIVKLDKYIDYLEDKLNELLISDVSERLNNNCTLCKHYNYKYIENKAKNETHHYCTNFVKIGETIEYNCNKFEPNAR